MNIYDRVMRSEQEVRQRKAQARIDRDFWTLRLNKHWWNHELRGGLGFDCTVDQAFDHLEAFAESLRQDTIYLVGWAALPQFNYGGHPFLHVVLRGTSEFTPRSLEDRWLIAHRHKARVRRFRRKDGVELFLKKAAQAEFALGRFSAGLLERSR